MSVITGIRTALKITGRLERRFRLLDPTNKFIQKYVPPGHRRLAFKVKKYLDVGITAGIIYDLLNIDEDANKRVRTPSGAQRKTRNYMEQSQPKRKYDPEYSYYNYGRKPKFCRPTKYRRYR